MAGCASCQAVSPSASVLVVRPGKVGRVALLGDTKFKVDVRSPHTARRKALMLGSTTPKRCSRKRKADVWSNTCELTQPPRLHGEITHIGTRMPGP
ncbi:hypothetical protein D3C73_1148620 [compost metagenome]